MIDGLHHLGMGRRLRAHDIMFEANVDQTGRQQPRHFARIRRRDQPGKRKAAEIVRHQALFARIELIGEFCADARHAVAFRRNDLLELMLARIRPLGDEIERELTAEGGGLPAQLSIARLFQAARRTGRPILADDGFEDRRLAREVIVKAAFANTHPARQLAHRGAAVTAFGKQAAALPQESARGSRARPCRPRWKPLRSSALTNERSFGSQETNDRSLTYSQHAKSRPKRRNNREE